jgi:hypothetical protein
MFFKELLAATFLACLASAGANFTDSCSDILLMERSNGARDLLNAECVALTPHDTAISHNSILDLNLCVGLDQEKGALSWSV